MSETARVKPEKIRCDACPVMCFIAEEVNVIVIIFYKLKAKCLVPAFWEDVKGNLTTDRERKVVFFELCL